MKVLVVVLAIYVSSTVAEPDWNGLRVKFGRHPEHLPRTVAEATRKGWKLDAECDVESNGFYGHRYIQDGDDMAAMLLFDDAGFIAGIQGGVKKGAANGYPSGAVKASFLEEKDKFTFSAYFTAVDKICNGGRSQAEFDAQGTGDRLILQDGQNLVTIPMEETDVQAPWGHGKCFNGMGAHKWYNLSTDMECSDIKPVFLLYNQGKLNAFGWFFLGNLPGKRFEHPPFRYFGAFAQTIPQCLKNVKISVLHIFMSDKRLSC